MPANVTPEPNAADAVPGAMGTTRRQWRLLLVASSVVAALAVGLVLGRQLDSDGKADAVSVGFLRDMTVHHAQAVEMASAVYRRSDDPKMTYLAYDILTTQQGQIGLMTGWLDRLGASASGSGPAMAWMGEPHDGPMPGMATDAEVESLSNLAVPQMHEQFLRLMIRHHRGALDMARYAADRAGDERVAGLADKMDKGQAGEIALMQDRLAALGVPAEDEGGHAGHSG